MGVGARSFFVALGALLWLLLRSGMKPTRILYPCQQAALGAAALGLGLPVVSLWLALRARTSRSRVWRLGLALIVVGALGALGAGAWVFEGGAPSAPQLDPPGDYRARVYDRAGCAGDPAGERFPCLDDLVEIMGADGLKLYRSATPSLIAGPSGIVGADDVVLIKINYQWPERGGTNTDLLRGLIRRIVDHPDGFTGEVVVCENGQFQSLENFDRATNNAQDPALSPHDVVVGFQSKGFRVSHYDWGTIQSTSVGEYSSGNLTDGYVLGAYDARFQGRISYPKFRTAHGARVSTKLGLWTFAGGYDRTRLKRINLPVLKSHHAVYGATAMLKNNMGLVTTGLSTNSHTAVRYGILGQVLAEIGPADLNILDAIWINANPFDGPWTTYLGATRTNRLVASLDPIAGDLWAVKHVLVPAFMANGYAPPWPAPSADPDGPSSAFREYLDNSMGFLLAAGHTVTNDPAQIDAVDLAPPGEVSDPAGPAAPFLIGKHPSGYALSWSAPTRGGAVESYVLYRVALSGGVGPAIPQCESPLGVGLGTVLTTLSPDSGFLVVARNGAGDGSFGRDATGRERPSPSAPCP